MATEVGGGKDGCGRIARRLFRPTAHQRRSISQYAAKRPPRLGTLRVSELIILPGRWRLSQSNERHTPSAPIRPSDRRPVSSIFSELSDKSEPICALQINLPASYTGDALESPRPFDGAHRSHSFDGHSVPGIVRARRARRRHAHEFAHLQQVERPSRPSLCAFCLTCFADCPAHHSSHRAQTFPTRCCWAVRALLERSPQDDLFDAPPGQSTSHPL